MAPEGGGGGLTMGTRCGPECHTGKPILGGASSSALAQAFSTEGTFLRARPTRVHCMHNAPAKPYTRTRPPGPVTCRVQQRATPVLPQSGGPPRVFTTQQSVAGATPSFVGRVFGQRHHCMQQHQMTIRGLKTAMNSTHQAVGQFLEFCIADLL